MYRNKEPSEEDIHKALSKQEALPAHRIELGGGYYYKCHWIACNESVSSWMNYCPNCGQRLTFENCTGATLRRSNEKAKYN